MHLRSKGSAYLLTGKSVSYTYIWQGQRQVTTECASGQETTACTLLSKLWASHLTPLLASCAKKLRKRGGSVARLMQPTIKALFARHSQRKQDSAAEPAHACSKFGRSGPPSAFSEAAERTEPSAPAELAEAAVARPPGACPGSAEAAAAEPSTVLSSSGELRQKKRGRAFDYFLVRLPAQFASSISSSGGCANLPLPLTLCRCWTVRQPATKARTW